MILDITELNFPKKDGKQYATLTQATANIADMGEKTITTQVKIDGNIVPDFSFDWEVAFQGEKYIMPLRIPQGAKENTSLNSTIDLTFQHWAIYQLKRWPFVTIQQIAAGTYLPDEEVATVQLNLKDFCILFGQVLEYYYGGAITIDLNPAWQYKHEATLITISHTKIWNVLIDAFHDKYGVRWEIKAAADNSNTVKGGERYVIRVGYPTTEVDHIFEYGFEGGLLKVERQVQSEEIRNMLKGRGGDTNIPFRYFKNTDPNNEDFRPDPDWVEELANIYFPNLMPATFRSYVQGWKAAHISKYPGYTAVGESNAYAPWAYRKGYTDTKFAPVEFVADEITINPESGDKQVEILPGYSPYVKKGSSLDKYGPLPDTLDNNDDIYPTLQGTGLDIAVAVEQIQSDDVAESTENDAKTSDFKENDKPKISETLNGGERKVVEARSGYFYVESGKYADLDEGPKTFTVSKDGRRLKPHVENGKLKLIEEYQIGVESYLIEAEDVTLTVVNAHTGEERSASGIPAGTYYFRIRMTLHNTSSDKLNITVACEEPKVISATLDDSKWRNTFDIWVKNIWDSTKLSTETDTQYAERVWKPVLGDREKNAAKVVFTSGALVHEDYEFTIVDFPVLDTSKAWEEKDDNGVVIATHTSHWRITLAKSDAELEATGLYVPSTKKQGKAGDRFVFIGTEMTHVPYVVDAEERLDDWKKDQLGEKKEIKPTVVVTTDRVRLNNEGKPNALINQLRVGNSLRLFDKRFFNEEGKAYETLYLQSITYTYREPTSDDAALNPDVQIVLGNEYATSANPVSMMQGEISALQKQVGSISNVEQIVRAVGDRLYLRKDGISDRSLSPTQFFSLLTSGDFRSGIVGGAGWGVFKDENGNWVLEADRVNVRQEMQVNTLVINQAEGRGGMEIDTAAYIDGVTRVVETDSGYVCYFDQKNGSVANLFHIDDVAYCNRWTPENTELKFYKRRVIAVGVDNITLSKTDVNGSGIPAEKDNIIHFGNYTDKTRQYVKVRDVVGGGYERYIEELSSVNATGVEYYFVGRQDGQQPRWFIGNKDLVPYSGKGDGSYIEYKDRKFHLNNVSLTISGKPIDQYIEDTTKEETAEMIKDTDILFIAHTSQTVAPVLPLLAADGTIAQLNGWTTDAPAAQAGLYIWQTTYVLRGDGTASFVGTSCTTGRDGSSYTENLLTGTRDFTGGWDYLDRGTVTADTYKGCRVFETTRQWGSTNRPVHLEPGTYTFSAYARVSSQEQVNIYLNAAQNTQPVIGTDWQRIRFVFRVDTAGTYNPRIEKHLATSTVLYTAGWKVEEGENLNPVWSPAPSEQVGQSAKTVIVNSDATAFMYEDNFNKLTGPNTINLTATLQGTTGYQWSYKTPSMAAFVDMQGMTSATYSLPPTASGWGSDKSMTLRCTSGGVHDEVTIAKVSSGAKGANGSNFTENLLYKSKTSLSGNANFFLFSSKRLRQIGAGKKITVSFDYEYSGVTTGSTGFTRRFGMEDHLESVTGDAIYFGTWIYLPENSSGLSGKGRHSETLVIPENLSESSLNTEVFNFYIQIAGGQCTISNFKVEEGDNHAPVWTPNSSEMVGTDAYTVLLTNESHTFAGDSEKAVASSTDCGIVAYKGATQVAATIGTISGMPSGMTAAVSGNGTTAAKFTVSVTTALTQRQGTLSVPVTVDGKTFTKKFSWSLSLEGKGAHSIYLKGWQTNNNKHSSRVVMVDGKYVGLDNRRGLRLVTLNRETLKMVTDILYDTYADTPSNHPRLDSLIGQLESLDDSVFVTLTSADAMSLSQELINELSKFGGMIDTVVWQACHAFAFIGYKGLQPGYAQWMIDKTVGTSTSAPAEVSAYVANGMFTTSKTQTGVKSITEEYYLSTSRDTPAGGSWSAVRPAWVAGHFYWTRTKVTYTDGTFEYKGEICATGETGQDGEPGRPGVDATFSPNLVPSAIYDPEQKGGGLTNAVKWIPQCWTDSASAIYRINLIGWPIKEAGWYSVYFMARRVSGAGAVSVDINDCGITVTPDLSTIDGNWRAFSGKVYVNQHIGVNGFIDFMNGDGIELSDITVTKGETVPASWLPTAPELTGGSDNLLMRSDVEVSNAGYPIASYRIAETLNNNEMLTCTIWGDLKGGSPRWGLYNSSGNHFLQELYRVADGVYSATVRWVTNTDTNNDTLVVYPMDRTDATAVSTIRCIKLERGVAATPWSRSSHDFDFITAAMKQDTEVINGLILSALMKLGVVDESGARRIMAGINGLVNSSDDLALWAGGDMVDADKFPNDPDRAAAAIRHNGTAYFARNVIRMLSDYMMVGDNVRLDKDGLRLLSDGKTVLEIANKPVSTDFSLLASNESKFTRVLDLDVPIDVSGPPSYIADDTYQSFDLGTLNVGSTVEIIMSCTGSQPIPDYTGNHGAYPVDGYVEPLRVFLRKTSDDARTGDEVRMYMTSGTSGSSHYYTLRGSAKFTVYTTGSYTVDVGFDGGSNDPLQVYMNFGGNLAFSVKKTISNQMVIGNNGLAVIRDYNAIAINDDMAVMRSGSAGFALHPTHGIAMTLNGGQNWYAAQLSGSQIVFNKKVTL